jgi:hypothetical protein
VRALPFSAGTDRCIGRPRRSPASSSVKPMRKSLTVVNEAAGPHRPTAWPSAGENGSSSRRLRLHFKPVNASDHRPGTRCSEHTPMESGLQPLRSSCVSECGSVKEHSLFQAPSPSGLGEEERGRGSGKERLLDHPG